MTYVKQDPGLPPGAFVHEAAGLAWLAEVPNGCRVVRVQAVGVDRLLLDHVQTSAPTAQAARTFGACLARTHAAGADAFGVLPPGVHRGYIAGVEIVDGNWLDFGPFYAQARLLPLAEQAESADCLTRAQSAVIRELAERVNAGEPDVCGPPEEPSRLHGDLWSGNVLWQRRNAVLIDPSAHGGHRESDLAMLALFGLPYLDEVFDGYQEVWSLSAGWENRRALHQVYPLLVHALLFGGAYGAAAARAARAAIPS